MTLATLAEVETILLGPAPSRGAGLVGKVLAGAGFAATGESPVAAIAPFISQALIECGITPANLISPDDADLAKLQGRYWFMFLDLVQLFLLEQAAIGMADMVKREEWPHYKVERMGLTEFMANLQARREAVRRRWGYGAGTLKPGSYTLNAPGRECEFGTG